MLSATDLERPQTPPIWGRFFWRINFGDSRANRRLLCPCGMDRPDSGHAVIVRRQIIKLSSDWVSFRKNLDRLYPQHDELPLGYASMRMTARVYKERGPPTEA